MQKNRPARPALYEETTPLPFPAMSDNESVSSEPSKDNFKKFWYGDTADMENCIKYVLTRCLSRNTPQDPSPSPISFDEMLEIFNQISIFVAKPPSSKAAVASAQTFQSLLWMRQRGSEAEFRRASKWA